MNIEFSYLYRDASNYKQYHQVVFANPNNISLEKIQTVINNKLIDGNWFVSKNWNLPDMHFKEYSWDNEADHEWHELDCIEETTEHATIEVSIEDFIEAITVKQ